MADGVKQYGELATQLLTDARRSTQTDTLLKYNDVLVRSILREQRHLEALLTDILNRHDDAALGDDPNTPTILLYQTAILRNKRCLLAYHHHRLERLKDMFWNVGGALPLLLSTRSTTTAAGGAGASSAAAKEADVRSKLSPHEVDFLRQYSESLLEFRSGVLATEEVDLFAPITRPPKDLHVLVKVVRDCGVIQTEVGAIDFRRGQRFLVRRADVEHLITQGYLEEV